jgi:Secretion system C-terminal sorting domain
MSFFSGTMASTLLSLLALAITVSYNAAAQQVQPPVKQWDKGFGSTDLDRLTTLIQTRDGGYLAAGMSSGDVSGSKTAPSKGFTDYWIVKLDGNGTKQWDKGYGTRFWDELQAVCQTADGGYILGGYSYTDNQSLGDKTDPGYGKYDYWVVKIDAQGNKQWDKVYGGTEDDQLFDLQLTADGGYILGGYSRSPVGGDKTQDNKGVQDYWVVKIDAAGRKMWDKTIGGDGTDRLQTIQVTSDGGYILAGGSDSNRSGDKSENSRGTLRQEDYWVVKLNAAGDKQWDRTYGSGGVEYFAYLQQTRDGGYILGGTTDFTNVSGDRTQQSKGGRDFWVIKLDETGAKQWDRTFGGLRDDEMLDMQPTSDGGYVLIGATYSGRGGDKSQPNQGDRDYWLVNINAEGDRRWEIGFGGNTTDIPLAVQQTSDGGYILGGYSGSDVSGDKTAPIIPAANYHNDYWLIKLAGSVFTSTHSANVQNLLRTYPNPAHHNLNLQLGQELRRQNMKISLRDNVGRTVYQQTITGIPGADLPISIGAQPAGLYLLQVEGTNGVMATQRVVLE